MKGSAERRTVLTVLGLEPKKIGGLEAYARELSLQLGEQGWRSVLCFLSPPPKELLGYFDLPHVIVETMDGANSGVKYYCRLTKLLARYRPTILHVHLVSLFGPYAWLARLFGAKSVFFTDHTSRPAGYVSTSRSLVKRMLFRGMLAPLNRAVCVSGYVEECLVRGGILPATQTTVIYNGVDLSRVEAGMSMGGDFRKAYDIPLGAFLVIQVGQIIPEKGVSDLLEAASRICQVDPTVRFLLVGDGSGIEEYRKQATALGLAGCVKFAGPIADPLAKGVFAAADLVC